MTETQNGFRKGRSCIHPTLPQIINSKRREYNSKTQLLRIDYDKTFDSTKRQILWDILNSKIIPSILLKATMDITHKTKY
jgi:Reverse transcriptase (RNA-dependent DNA polymerase).